MPAIDDNGREVSMEEFWKEVSNTDTSGCYVKQGLGRGFIVELISGYKASYHCTTEELRGGSALVPYEEWKGWCT